MNIELSHQTILAAIKWGITEFCICAGARNSPLMLVLEKAKNIKLYNFFDERSAAFFALGRIQSTKKPVAVVTTSGTAVAELLPAAVEAYYSGWPLLLITADRPKRFRGTGAPQAIEQVGIFSHYVEKCEDLDFTNIGHSYSLWSKAGPYQLNVCFDEPLIDKEIPTLDVNSIVPTEFSSAGQTIHTSENSTRKISQPLVIISSLTKEEVPFVEKFLRDTQCLYYSEALSQLSVPADDSNCLRAGEKSIQFAFSEKYFDSVIRIGGIPTLRFWRDLEEKFSSVPVNSFSRNEFTGLSRNSKLSLSIESLKFLNIHLDPVRIQKIKDKDFEYSQKLTGLLDQFPKSEASMMKKIAQAAQSSRVYLGNSLPIREWDLVDQGRCYNGIFGHRGANGIDGQVSGFLGLCSTDSQNIGVFGDLTAMYDLQALWISTQIDPADISIVVINNGGGQIFNRLFKKDSFLNSHDYEFKKWAEMFGWGYQRITDVDQQLLQPGRRIIEVVPDKESSQMFWQKYDQI